MTTRTQNPNETEQIHNGRLTFYHPNNARTGSAVRIELRLNRKGESGYNCFFLEMARQSGQTAGEKGKRRHARFDWENKITVKLGFTDVCELMAVLEGRKAEAGNGKRGIYHAAGNSNTIITFKKRPDAPGYLLGLSRKSSGSDVPNKAHIILSDVEALGLGHVFRSSLFHMAFFSSLQRSSTRKEL